MSRTAEPGLAPASATSHRAPSTTSAPQASRSRAPGWRDPRLWVGIALVAGSVVAGARIVGAADDTTTVWAAADDLAPGAPLEASDLVPARVGFDSPDDLARYVATSDALPAEGVLVQGVAQGDLLPRSALGTSAEAESLTLSISVPADLVPPSVGRGSRVDVYVLSDPAQPQPSAEAVLRAVVVVDAPAASGELGAVGTGRQLVLAVPADRTRVVGEVLAANRDDRVRVVGAAG